MKVANIPPETQKLLMSLALSSCYIHTKAATQRLISTSTYLHPFRQPGPSQFTGVHKLICGWICAGRSAPNCRHAFRRRSFQNQIANKVYGDRAGLSPSRRSPVQVRKVSVLRCSHNSGNTLRWASSSSRTMADLATKDYLAYLKSLYPQHASKSGSNVEGILQSTWYLVAAVAFSASNRPEAIPKVFAFVSDELDAESATTEQTFLVARRFREAIFKAGLLCGFSRVGRGEVNSAAETDGFRACY